MRKVCSLGFALVLGGVGWLGISGMDALAQAPAASDYPQRPVRLIVPFEPGGGADIIARIVTKPLNDLLGQPVVIMNKPGAGTIVGAQALMQAPPDGYTLLLADTGTVSVNPTIYPNLPYTPSKDFTPIAMVAIGQNVLVVNPSLPVHSVSEFIEYARAHPHTLHFGSSGAGGVPHMDGELLNAMAKTDLVHVPYKGSAPAMLDVMSGRVQAMFSGLGAALPQIKSGRVRALAVAGGRRSPSLPELPSMSETLKGYDGATWFPIVGPAHMPQATTDLLSSDIEKVLARDDVKQQLLQAGYEPYVMDSHHLGPFFEEERLKWRHVIDTQHIKTE